MSVNVDNRTEQQILISLGSIYEVHQSVLTAVEDLEPPRITLLEGFEPCTPVIESKLVGNGMIVHEADIESLNSCNQQNKAFNEEYLKRAEEVKKYVEELMAQRAKMIGDKTHIWVEKKLAIESGWLRDIEVAPHEETRFDILVPLGENEKYKELEAEIQLEGMAPIRFEETFIAE